MENKLEELFLKIVKDSKFVPKMTLDKNVDNFTSNIGIRVRRLIQPVIKKILKNKTDRNVILEKFPNIDKKDVLMFVCTHSLEQDVIATYVTVDRSYYTVIGTIEQVKNYPKIIFGWIQGLIVVDRHNKESKKTINDKQVRVHNKGTSSFICAEASYNNSENLPIEKIFNGFYRAANRSNENVKVVVISHFADYNYKDYYKEDYYNNKGQKISFEFIENLVHKSSEEEIKEGFFKNVFYNKNGEKVDLTDLALSIYDGDLGNNCHTRYSDPVDLEKFFEKRKDLQYNIYYDKKKNKLDIYKLYNDIIKYNNLNNIYYLTSGKEVNLLEYNNKNKISDSDIFYNKNYDKVTGTQINEIITNYSAVKNIFDYIIKSKNEFNGNFSEFEQYLKESNKKEKEKMPIITEHVRNIMATETWYQLEDNTRVISRKNLPEDARRQFFRSRYDEYVRVNWPNIETLLEELIYYEGKNPDIELVERRKEFYNLVIDFWLEDHPEDHDKIDVESLRKKINHFHVNLINKPTIRIKK